MNNELKQELLNHIITRIEDLNLEDFEELHHVCFNEDYYIIGHYQAEQWLKAHDISAFEAIETVIEWELEVFGEISLKPTDINAEKIVNLYVYVLGERLLSEFDLDQSQKQLLADLKNELD